jgi:hypothetical protein
MDGKRFDDLIRRLSDEAASRRTGVRIGLGVLLGVGLGSRLLPWEGDEAAAKKGKKKKTSCPRRTQPCGKACIPAKDCCLNPKRGTSIKNGAAYRQCGLCADGVLLTTLACATLDPEGCTECSDRFTCAPVADGTACRGCGTCQGGLCENGCESATAKCCPDGKCGETCCANGRACNTTCCGKDGNNFCCAEDQPVCICGGCWQVGSVQCDDPKHCCGPLSPKCCGNDHCCAEGYECLVGCPGNTCCKGGQSDRCCPDGVPG